MTPIAQAAAAVAFALGVGLASVSVLRGETSPVTIPAGPWTTGGALDGRAFQTVDTVRETGEVLTDTLYFADGRFQSAKCQDYCDFGWTEYRTWHDGAAIHFTVETACPDAPHSIVWIGTVEDDVIRVAATWTTRRWYWTRQIGTTGQGVSVPPLSGDHSG